MRDLIGTEGGTERLIVTWWHGPYVCVRIFGVALRAWWMDGQRGASIERA